MIFNWNYKYDEKDRLIEESALDGPGSLMAQIVWEYNEKDQLVTHAAFVKHQAFHIWDFYLHPSGLKYEDARFFASGAGYFKYNWKERRFIDLIEAYDYVPVDDMYQRWSYKFGPEGRLQWSRLYDKFRKNIEINQYKYNAKIQLRTLVSTLPERDSLKVAWDFRYDANDKLYETNVVTMETGKMKRFNYEYDVKEAKLRKETRWYVSQALHHYHYNENGRLTKLERNSMFDEPEERMTISEEGLIEEMVFYYKGVTPYRRLKYNYK